MSSLHDMFSSAVALLMSAAFSHFGASGVTPRDVHSTPAPIVQNHSQPVSTPATPVPAAQSSSMAGGDDMDSDGRDDARAGSDRNLRRRHHPEA